MGGGKRKLPGCGVGRESGGGGTHNIITDRGKVPVRENPSILCILHVRKWYLTNL